MKLDWTPSIWITWYPSSSSSLWNKSLKMVLDEARTNLWAWTRLLPSLTRVTSRRGKAMDWRSIRAYWSMEGVGRAVQRQRASYVFNNVKTAVNWALSRSHTRDDWNAVLRTENCKDTARSGWGRKQAVCKLPNHRKVGQQAWPGEASAMVHARTAPATMILST